MKLRLLNLPDTAALENPLLGMVRCVRPWGAAGSATWNDPSECLSASTRLLKISGMYILTCGMVKCKVVDPHANGFHSFSGNLFEVLIYYFEVYNVGMEVVVGFTVDINFTGDMTVMSFHSIFCLVCQCKINCNLLQDKTTCGLYSV